MFWLWKQQLMSFLLLASHLVSRQVSFWRLRMTKMLWPQLKGRVEELSTADCLKASIIYSSFVWQTARWIMNQGFSSLPPLEVWCLLSTGLGRGTQKTGILPFGRELLVLLLGWYQRTKYASKFYTHPGRCLGKRGIMKKDCHIPNRLTCRSCTPERPWHRSLQTAGNREMC